MKGNTEIGEPDKFIVERKPGDVNDMYIITGIYKNLKNNDNMLAWIQMDKMSHALESSEIAIAVTQAMIKLQQAGSLTK